MQSMTGFRLVESFKAVAIPVLLIALSSSLSGCGGEGDSSSSNPPPAGSVTVSGKIEFERAGFKTVSNGGLNITAPTVQPARQVVVEAIDPTTRARIGTATSTDTNGVYSLTIPANTNVLISARAEMVKADAAPTWDFKVRDNTASDALYVLDGAAFNSGTANSTRNLRALTGWNGTTYVDADRHAAPFAILDTVYQAKEIIRTAQPSTVFPALNLYWSTENRASVASNCTTSGNIGTSFYTGEVPASDADNCTPSVAMPAGIYVLGDYANGNGDTDEFDQHVIAHEFGHYIEDKFSRSDSIGGTHGATDELDMRVAFGEGWGNAYSAMALNDPAYRDSYQGVATDGGFNLESDPQQGGLEGWFSELSIGQILWDLFDPTDDGADHVSLGFAPIYAVMTGGEKDTDALTSVFTFTDALRIANPAQAAGIGALLTGESIATTDAFGSGETNSGGSTTSLPIYQDITINDPPIIVCNSSLSQDRNKVGYRKLLRLNVPQPSALTITAIGAVDPSTPSVAASDPDIFVYKKGVVVQFSDTTTSAVGSSETISQKPFAAGLHIIEVYDYNLSGTNATKHCMSVSVTGP
ncbi:MAG: hypothetical protein ACJ8OJ_03635 [Povalibacter sp.]